MATQKKIKKRNLEYLDNGLVRLEYLEDYSSFGLKFPNFPDFLKILNLVIYERTGKRIVIEGPPEQIAEFCRYLMTGSIPGKNELPVNPQIDQIEQPQRIKSLPKSLPSHNINEIEIKKVHLPKCNDFSNTNIRLDMVSIEERKTGKYLLCNKCNQRSKYAISHELANNIKSCYPSIKVTK